VVEVGVISSAHASKAESRSNSGIRVSSDRKLGEALTAPSRANVAMLADEGAGFYPRGIIIQNAITIVLITLYSNWSLRNEVAQSFVRSTRTSGS